MKFAYEVKMTQIKMHGINILLTSSISTGFGVKLKSKLVLGCGWVGVWPVSRVVVVVVTFVVFVQAVVAFITSTCHSNGSSVDVCAVTGLGSMPACWLNKCGRKSIGTARVSLLF